MSRGICVGLIDNNFVSVDKLVADFFEDVKRWRDENSND